MQYEEIRRQVLGAIREAQARGLIHGTSGNIAVRQPGGDVVAITPSGRPYDTMQPEDIAIVTFTEKDVVRHKIVQDIIKAYERYYNKNKR